MDILRLAADESFSHDMDENACYAKKYWGKLILPADFDEEAFDAENAYSTYNTNMIGPDGKTNGSLPDALVREYLRAVKMAGGTIPPPTGGLAADLKAQLDGLLRTLTDSAKNKPAKPDIEQAFGMRPTEITLKFGDTP